MTEPKEKYVLISLFVSISVSIFGAGILYQKAENNERNIELILKVNNKLNDKDDIGQRDIKDLAERISRLEAKIDALDKWCRNNLKK